MSNVPKYIENILSRSKFALGYGEPGYTIEVEKESPYTKADALKHECEKLVAWVERQMPHDEYSVPTAVINRMPAKTHYCRQFAIVTVYDPVMRRIEQYIKG